MFRVLRVIGIIVFAAIVGYSANNLWEMHQAGELAERYNSARKANVTMMVFSIIMVAALGCFELARIRRYSEYKGYGRSSRGEEEETEGLDSTADIYAARPASQTLKTHRRHHSGRNRQKQRLDASNIWMGLLRIWCVLMPVLYTALLVQTLKAGSEAIEISWLVPTALSALILLSVVSSIGLFAKKTWGMSLGYLLAICNLMVFPYGTALGLFFLMALVGSSSKFIDAERGKKRRPARHRSARRTQRALT